MPTEDNRTIDQLDKHPYVDDFYLYIEEGSRVSARIMVPLIIELVQPRSVIDIGCGTGEWLAIFEENGIEDVWGVDGPYVNRKLLKITEERFIPADLNQPFHIDREFDLVACLEVAEHLLNSSAETFVNSLTELGPIIVFSAAIPQQGGEKQLNEQWPEYWAKLFKGKGYVVIDPLRKKVWNNNDVEVWYAQNILMFVAHEHLETYPLLSKEYELRDTSMLSVVHPRMFLHKIEGIKEEAKFRNLLVRKTSNILGSVLPPGIYGLIRATYRLTRYRRIRPPYR